MSRTLLSCLAGLLFAVAAGGLTGCGQKGTLYVPHTPAAAQRATLPQTLWGGGERAAAPASAASAALPPPPPPNPPPIR